MPTVDLLALPWQVQLTLASGFAAYALAYAGIRAHHKTIEVAFATLVFGLVATTVFAYLQQKQIVGAPAAMALAFFVTVAVGFLWRKVGRRFVRWFLRTSHISHADDDPSAWGALFDGAEFDVSQIAVRLDDGTWLRCDDTTPFADAPHGPCILGGTGDIIMYLTEEQSADGTTKELKTVRHDDFGDRLTYVPANRISLINIRCKRR